QRSPILSLDALSVTLPPPPLFPYTTLFRSAREVGTEGRLGGQANVLGVAGTWKDLTESVNSMASNLTAQVRNIAEVTTAVANGAERKSTRVNSSHVSNSSAVFCAKTTKASP